jgi:hypothetical protein
LLLAGTGPAPEAEEQETTGKNSNESSWGMKNLRVYLLRISLPEEEGPTVAELLVCPKFL